MAATIDYRLGQRGRAGMDFLLELSRARGGLMREVAEELDAAGVSEGTLPADLDDQHAFVGRSLADAPAWAVAGKIQEFSAVTHGMVAQSAFEEIRSQLYPTFRDLEAAGPATLAADPALSLPAYYDNVWFHRTRGGWDGHADQGFIHGEIIHRHYVGALFGGDIFAQRRSVLEDLPRRDFRNILELGTSAGHYTVAIQEAFPAARITGIDLSVPMLRQALRMANLNGWAWDLRQMAGEATSFADGSFDLVTAYSYLHELPESVIRQTFSEAHRLLEPGGYVLISDVTPYLAQDRMKVWRADHDAITGGEPYWRESASLDWGQVARGAGFELVESYGRGERQFPWSVMGRKA